MTEHPKNYWFWEDEDHFPASLGWWGKKPDEEITVIGSEDVITNFQGYDVPKDFLLYRDQNGNIGSAHESRITQHDEE